MPILCITREGGINAGCTGAGCNGIGSNGIGAGCTGAGCIGAECTGAGCIGTGGCIGTNGIGTGIGAECIGAGCIAPMALAGGWLQPQGRTSLREEQPSLPRLPPALCWPSLTGPCLTTVVRAGGQIQVGFFRPDRCDQFRQ